MLKTIQLITLLQGFFLLLVLIRKKDDFKKVNFWLLVGTIMSILVYALGDDDFNVLVEHSDWYFFYDFLFITFFLLLIKYRNDKTGIFKRKDLLFFIPYTVFVIAQFLENTFHIDRLYVLLVGIGTSMSMVGYLIYIFKKIIENKEKWMIYFMIPYTLIFLADRLGNINQNKHDGIPFLESYGVIGLSAVLFYIILYKLILTPSALLPQVEVEKYKSTRLEPTYISEKKQLLKQLFEKEKVFTNNKLTVDDVAKTLKIPRQHLSEILSMHLNTNFQDFVNTHRVDEFIACLQNPKYENYTLLGISKEVGFNSKTSFYTTFKKLKGMTPLEYKKTVLENGDSLN